MEAYEQKYGEGFFSHKKNKSISVRTQETMLPTILIDTAKALYGHPVKAKPMPISRITPDIGSVTIWGEIFRWIQN